MGPSATYQILALLWQKPEGFCHNNANIWDVAQGGHAFTGL